MKCMDLTWVRGEAPGSHDTKISEKYIHITQTANMLKRDPVSGTNLGEVKLIN